MRVRTNTPAFSSTLSMGKKEELCKNEMAAITNTLAYLSGINKGKF